MSDILLWGVVISLLVKIIMFGKKLKKELSKFITASILLFLIPVFLYSENLNMNIKFAIANCFILFAFWAYALYQYKIKKLLNRTRLSEE
ncbi:MAG: hypothetical protein CVV02_05040 [Firmicutes bacterium HGW-Firmicutes-7]|nr:MAG: hypothetical protein CVV02_05040 [Firmicutes bacterium HGW-Firmicutes-7]